MTKPTTGAPTDSTEQRARELGAICVMAESGPHAAEIIKAALIAERQKVVPENWQIVPKEPTVDMEEAAGPSRADWIGHPEANPASIDRWVKSHQENVIRVYKAMLAAAPPPPATE